MKAALLVLHLSLWVSSSLAQTLTERIAAAKAAATASKPETLCLLGTFQQLAFQLEEAEASYQQAVEAKAGSGALSQLWELRLKYAEPAPAMQPLLELVQQQQFTQEQLLTLGSALLDSYRYPEAVALLQAACQAMPTAHVLHHLHGVALEQAGQPAAAVAAYELALATAQKALATEKKATPTVSAAAQRAAALSDKLWQVPKIPELAELERFSLAQQNSTSITRHPEGILHSSAWRLISLASSPGLGVKAQAQAALTHTGLSFGHLLQDLSESDALFWGFSRELLQQHPQHRALHAHYLLTRTQSSCSAADRSALQSCLALFRPDQPMLSFAAQLFLADAGEPGAKEAALDLLRADSTGPAMQEYLRQVASDVRHWDKDKAWMDFMVRHHTQLLPLFVAAHPSSSPSGISSAWPTATGLPVLLALEERGLTQQWISAIQTLAALPAQEDYVPMRMGSVSGSGIHYSFWQDLQFPWEGKHWNRLLVSALALADPLLHSPLKMGPAEEAQISAVADPLLRIALWRRVGAEQNLQTDLAQLVKQGSVVAHRLAAWVAMNGSSADRIATPDLELGLSHLVKAAQAKPEAKLQALLDNQLLKLFGSLPEDKRSPAHTAAAQASLDRLFQSPEGHYDLDHLAREAALVVPASTAQPAALESSEHEPSVQQLLQSNPSPMRNRAAMLKVAAYDTSPLPDHLAQALLTFAKPAALAPAQRWKTYGVLCQKLSSAPAAAAAYARALQIKPDYREAKLKTLEQRLLSPDLSAVGKETAALDEGSATQILRKVMGQNYESVTQLKLTPEAKLSFMTGLAEGLATAPSIPSNIEYSIQQWLAHPQSPLPAEHYQLWLQCSSYSIRQNALCSLAAMRLQEAQPDLSPLLPVALDLLKQSTDSQFFPTRSITTSSYPALPLSEQSLLYAHAWFTQDQAWLKKEVIPVLAARSPQTAQSAALAAQLLFGPETEFTAAAHAFLDLAPPTEPPTMHRRSTLQWVLWAAAQRRLELNLYPILQGRTDRFTDFSSFTTYLQQLPEDAARLRALRSIRDAALGAEPAARQQLQYSYLTLLQKQGSRYFVSYPQPQSIEPYFSWLQQLILQPQLLPSIIALSTEDALPQHPQWWAWLQSISTSVLTRSPEQCISFMRLMKMLADGADFRCWQQRRGDTFFERITTQILYEKQATSYLKLLRAEPSTLGTRLFIIALEAGDSRAARFTMMEAALRKGQLQGLSSAHTLERYHLLRWLMRESDHLAYLSPNLQKILDPLFQALVPAMEQQADALTQPTSQLWHGNTYELKESAEPLFVRLAEQQSAKAQPFFKQVFALLKKHSKPASPPNEPDWQDFLQQCLVTPRCYQLLRPILEEERLPFSTHSIISLPLSQPEHVVPTLTRLQMLEDAPLLHLGRTLHHYDGATTLLEAAARALHTGDRSSSRRVLQQHVKQQPSLGGELLLALVNEAPALALEAVLKRRAPELEKLQGVERSSIMHLLRNQLPDLSPVAQSLQKLIAEDLATAQQLMAQVMSVKTADQLVSLRFSDSSDHYFRTLATHAPADAQRLLAHTHPLMMQQRRGEYQHHLHQLWLQKLATIPALTPQALSLMDPTTEEGRRNLSSTVQRLSDQSRLSHPGFVAQLLTLPIAHGPETFRTYTTQQSAAQSLLYRVANTLRFVKPSTSQEAALKLLSTPPATLGKTLCFAIAQQNPLPKALKPHAADLTKLNPAGRAELITLLDEKASSWLTAEDSPWLEPLRSSRRAERLVLLQALQGTAAIPAELIPLEEKTPDLLHDLASTDAAAARQLWQTVKQKLSTPASEPVRWHMPLAEWLAKTAGTPAFFAEVRSTAQQLHLWEEPSWQSQYAFSIQQRVRKGSAAYLAMLHTAPLLGSAERFDPVALSTYRPDTLLQHLVEVLRYTTSGRGSDPQPMVDVQAALAKDNSFGASILSALLSTDPAAQLVATLTHRRAELALLPQASHLPMAYLLRPYLSQHQLLGHAVPPALQQALQPIFAAEQQAAADFAQRIQDPQARIPTTDRLATPVARLLLAELSQGRAKEAATHLATASQRALRQSGDSGTDPTRTQLASFLSQVGTTPQLFPLAHTQGILMQRDLKSSWTERIFTTALHSQHGTATITHLIALAHSAGFTQQPPAFTTLPYTSKKAASALNQLLGRTRGTENLALRQALRSYLAALPSKTLGLDLMRTAVAEDIPTAATAFRTTYTAQLSALPAAERAAVEQVLKER